TTVPASHDHLRRAAWLCGLSETEVVAPNGGSPRSEADPALLHLLVCPACRSTLEWHEQAICCAGCEAVYEVVEGIPVLRRPDGDGAKTQKDDQATFFDEADHEFEVTRPHG